MPVEFFGKHDLGNDADANVIFVHGAWHDRRCWNAFQSQVHSWNMNTFTFDLQGHGSNISDDKDEMLRKQRITDYTELLKEAIDQVEAMNDQPIFLVGHSMGGHVVQHALQTLSNSNQERIMGAVLIGSVPPWGALPTVLNIVGMDEEYKKILGDVMVRGYVTAVNKPFKPMLENDGMIKDLLYSDDSGLFNDFADRLQEESFKAFLDMVANNPPRQVSKNDQPLFIIGAEDDRIFSAATAKAMAWLYGMDFDVEAELVDTIEGVLVRSEMDSVAVLTDPDVLPNGNILEWFLDLDNLGPISRVSNPKQVKLEIYPGSHMFIQDENADTVADDVAAWIKTRLMYERWMDAQTGDLEYIPLERRGVLFDKLLEITGTKEFDFDADITPFIGTLKEEDKESNPAAWKNAKPEPMMG